MESEDPRVVRGRGLLEKLLDLERPFISAKMQEFFDEPDILRIFIAFISRTCDPSVPIPPPENDPFRDARRSFRVLELLNRSNSIFNACINRNMSIVVAELFKSFRPNSTANFYHVLSAMDCLAKIDSTHLMQTVTKQKVMNELLHCVENPQVAECGLKLLTYDCGSASRKLKFFEELANSSFISRVLQKLCEETEPSATADFFSGCFSLLSADPECGGIALQPLINDAKWIACLLQSVCTPVQEEGLSKEEAERVYEKRRERLEVLVLMANASREAFLAYPQPGPPPSSPISEISKQFASLSIPNVGGSLSPTATVPPTAGGGGNAPTATNSTPTQGSNPPTSPSSTTIVLSTLHYVMATMMKNGFSKSLVELVKMPREFRERHEWPYVISGGGCKSILRGSERKRVSEYLRTNQKRGVVVYKQVKGCSYVYTRAAIPYLRPLADSKKPKRKRNNEGASVSSSHPTSVSFSAFSVPYGLTSLRVSALELVMHFLGTSPATGFSQTLPSSFWAHALTLFFEYKYNNMLHSVFYKLFFLALKHRLQTPSGDYVICHMIRFLKLLPRLIDLYDSPDAGDNRGHALAIFNALRLYASSKQCPQKIRNILSSHPLWQEFCKNTLLSDTIAQAELSRNASELSAFSNEDKGIDLGSLYAKRLGFDSFFVPISSKSTIQKQDSQDLTEKLSSIASISPPAGTSSNLSQSFESALDDEETCGEDDENMCSDDPIEDSTSAIPPPQNAIAALSACIRRNMPLPPIPLPPLPPTPTPVDPPPKYVATEFQPTVSEEEPVVSQRRKGFSRSLGAAKNSTERKGDTQRDVFEFDG